MLTIVQGWKQPLHVGISPLGPSYKQGSYLAQERERAAGCRCRRVVVEGLGLASLVGSDPTSIKSKQADALSDPSSLDTPCRPCTPPYSA